MGFSLSVCLSFCLSVCLCNYLSPVCRHGYVHACYRWMDISEKNVHLLHIIWRCAPGIVICLDKISSFSCLFMFMDLTFFKKKRTIVFKIIKTTLVKALKCVFLELIHQISYFNVQYLESCVDFHFFNLGGGGWSIHFTGLNRCSGTMHMVEFCF